MQQGKRVPYIWQTFGIHVVEQMFDAGIAVATNKRLANMLDPTKEDHEEYARMKDFYEDRTVYDKIDAMYPPSEGENSDDEAEVLTRSESKKCVQVGRVQV